MRNVIWNFVRRHIPEGMILPWWAATAWAVLYPLDFFYWRMSQGTGFQPESDTWLIDGVTYSAKALRLFSEAQGETFRVTRVGEVVTLERVKEANNGREASE